MDYAIILIILLGLVAGLQAVLIFLYYNLCLYDISPKAYFELKKEKKYYEREYYKVLEILERLGFNKEDFINSDDELYKELKEKGAI